MRAIRNEQTSDDMPSPRFPAFDDWQRMSEREQDTLLARLERRKRWRGRLTGIVVASLLTAAAAGALYVTL
jgi:hypothetical protein